jgi:hypothetical protein
MANYPTETYTNLKSRFQALAGLSDLETTDADFLRQLVNRRVRMAYERYPWPNHVVINDSIAMTGKSNLILIYGGSKDTTDQADTVFDVWVDDPVNTKYPSKHDFVLTNSSGTPAVEVINDSDLTSTVYVSYRIALEDVIEDGAGYSTGFFGDSVGDNPNIPYQFFEYAVYGAYSDFLRGDGQTQKAIQEDQNAEMWLRQEIDKVRNQGGQFRHNRWEYRPTTQFRRHQAQAGGAPVNATASGILDNTTT